MPQSHMQKIAVTAKIMGGHGAATENAYAYK
jgi:hypothetical protein